MKKIFKKNQIIITALALMIAIAGYIQYTDSEISDKAAMKENDAELTEDTYEIFDEPGEEPGDGGVVADEPGDGGVVAEDIENPGEAVLTSTTVENIDFASEMKLNREQMRSKNKETLLEVINNTNISESQKQDAVDAMVHLTDIAEKEAAAEMLLEAKGFTDVVVSINDTTADVVLNMGEVTDAKRAQVEDIVKRKTEIAAENIVITPIQ